jgi:hypothetical protein
MFSVADRHSISDFRARVLVLAYTPESCNYDCSTLIATPRIQRQYDHRLQAMVKDSGSIKIALAVNLSFDLPVSPKSLQSAK